MLQFTLPPSSRRPPPNPLSSSTLPFFSARNLGGKDAFYSTPHSQQSEPKTSAADSTTADGRDARRRRPPPRCPAPSSRPLPPAPLDPHPTSSHPSQPAARSPRGVRPPAPALSAARQRPSGDARRWRLRRKSRLSRPGARSQAPAVAPRGRAPNARAHKHPQQTAALRAERTHTRAHGPLQTLRGRPHACQQV